MSSFYNANQQFLLVLFGVRLILGVCTCSYDQELHRSSDGHG